MIYIMILFLFNLSNDNNISKIRVDYVDVMYETFQPVGHNDFYKEFKDKLTTITIQDTCSIDKIKRMVDHIDKINKPYDQIVDVRVRMLIYYNNDRTDTLDFNLNRMYLNKQEINYSDELFCFIINLEKLKVRREIIEHYCE